MVGIAALLGGLGGVAIGFGLLLALMALVQPFMNPIWIIGNLVVGVVLLAAGVFMSFETLVERLRSGEGRRAGKYGSSAIVSTLLGLVILGLLGFMSVRYTHRFDVSESSVHTLSQQSIDVLDSLEERLEITAFFSESEAPPISGLLDRYDYASDRVVLRFIDPNSAPGLVQDLGLTSEDLARGIVRFELESGESTTLSEFSEPAITNALVKLVRSSGKTVYFVTGHNERIWTAPSGASPDGKAAFATAQDSAGSAAQALVNETYAVKPLLLASQADVPEDASTLVILGPTRPYLANEIAALRRYVEQGGSLFVALDPRSQTNLYDLLAEWGVSLGDDVIVDRALAVFGQATTPIAREYDAAHPITSLLREPALFPMARSVGLDAAARSNFSILVKTGEESWAERDLEAWRETGRAEYDPEDLLGPVPVGVAGTPLRATPDAELDDAAETEAESGRIVVFGDSDFATNEYFDALRNRDLFVNSVNWLSRDVEQITVRPNVSRASSFQMSEDEFRRIQVLSLFVVPEAIAVLGVVMWWLRRKAH